MLDMHMIVNKGNLHTENTQHKYSFMSFDIDPERIQRTLGVEAGTHPRCHTNHLPITMYTHT